MKPVKKKSNRMTVVVFLVCVFTLGASFAWRSWLAPAFSSENKRPFEVNQRQSESQAKQEAQKRAELAVDNKLAKLQQEVKAYLEKQPGNYGFMLYTKVNAGGVSLEKTISVNQYETFRLASTYKVPVVLYVYEQVAAGKIGLEDKLVYQAKFYAPGTGSLQYKKPGGRYTVRQLASLAIRESDNVALNILRDKVGRENILNYMQSLGGSAVYDDTPWGTPNDLIIYMKAVDKFATAHPDVGKYLIDDLKNTLFNDRIRAGTPKQVPVAHKIGNLDGVRNDVGIVYAPKGRYILAITSKNVPDVTKAEKAEAEVAKIVYTAIGESDWTTQ